MVIPSSLKMGEALASSNGDYTTELQVNESVNEEYFEDVNNSAFVDGNITFIDPQTTFVTDTGELIYVLHLDDTGPEGLQYYIVRNDDMDAEGVANQVPAVDLSHFEIANHFPYNEVETVALENETEQQHEVEEEVIDSLTEESEENVKVESIEVPTTLDHEQAAAANNLLEFHNQQIVSSTGMGAELFESLSDDTTGPELVEPDPLKLTTEDENNVNGTENLTNMEYGNEEFNQMLSQISTTQLADGVQVHPLPPTSYILPPRRKRKIIIYDKMKVISNSEFKQQLQNTSDIVRKLEMAPRTKEAMNRLKYSGVGRSFTHPGRKVQSASLAQLFHSRLIMKTEHQPNSIRSKNEPLKPLDPDLRTPESSLVDCVSHIPQTPGSHESLNMVVKKTVESFDQMIKGMNVSKAKKLEKSQKLLDAAHLSNGINGSG